MPSQKQTYLTYYFFNTLIDICQTCVGSLRSWWLIEEEAVPHNKVYQVAVRIAWEGKFQRRWPPLRRQGKGSPGTERDTGRGAMCLGDVTQHQGESEGQRAPKDRRIWVFHSWNLSSLWLVKVGCSFTEYIMQATSKWLKMC